MALGLPLYRKPMYMKNFTLCLLAVCCLFTSSILAQPRLAAKAGLNYGGLSGYNDGKKASGHAGLGIQWGGKNKIRVQQELNFQRLVQGYTVVENEVVNENALSVSFFSIPLMIQYYPAKSFYLEAGPQWSFTSGAKNEEAGGQKNDVKRNLAEVQFGVNAGAGIELKQKLAFYIRYQAGFTDMTLYDADNDFIRLVQAGLLMRFGKKK